MATPEQLAEAERLMRSLARCRDGGDGMYSMFLAEYDRRGVELAENSQDEYDKARRMPLCIRCMNLSEGRTR